MHARNAVRSIEKSLTLADSPYTVLPYIYNVIKVNTAGGNVRVNLPTVDYPIDVIKTSSDSYIVTVWVGGVQKATVAGELSKITIENAEVIADEPWYPYDAIVGIAGVSGDGGEVLAKDRYGRIIARGVAGTDDATVIDAPLATFTSGGLLRIASPLTLAHKINVPYNAITIEGNVGASTQLTLANNVNDSMIDSNGKNYLTIRNLKLNGHKSQQTSGHGIYCSGPSWLVRIDNVDVLSCKNNGIQFGDGTNIIQTASLRHVASENNDGCGIGISKLYYSYIDGCFLESNAIGIDISTASAISISNAECFSPIGIQFNGLSNSTIEKCLFGSSVENARGIVVATSGNGIRTRLMNNIFTFTGISNEGIRIAGTNWIVKNNYIYLSTALNANDRGLYLLNATNTVVENNEFRSCRTAIYATSVLTGHRIRRNLFDGCTTITNLTSGLKDNVGYLTESSGSSTGTGSEQTIAHSLAAIPVGCKAWIKYLVGARYITEMIPFDATNVYPTVDNGVAYEWRIE